MSDLNKIRADIISRIFDNSIYYPGTGEVFVFCPNGCHEKKRKLQINVSKGVGQCWVCGLSGTALDIVSKFGSRNDRKDYLSTISFKNEKKDVFEIEETKSVDLPDEFRLLNESQSPVAWPAKQYLREFSITERECSRFRIGICDSGEFSNRIIFPSFGADGKVNCFNTRSIFDSSYVKYSLVGQTKKVVFNELFVDWSKPIILVENVKAHIRHFDIGNVIPILGKKLSEEYTLFRSIVNNSCKKVYIALDPEESVKSLSYKRLFENYGIESKSCLLDCQPDEMATDSFADQVFKNCEHEEIDLLEAELRGVI